MLEFKVRFGNIHDEITFTDMTLMNNDRLLTFTLGVITARYTIHLFYTGTQTRAFAIAVKLGMIDTDDITL